MKYVKVCKGRNIVLKHYRNLSVGKINDKAFTYLVIGG